MKKLITLFFVCFVSHCVISQAIYEEFDSYKLGENRKIKIQLPRNYDADYKYGYPLVVVFDGDYLFEPVAGNIDYQSYWEDIPDCVIVGIKQVDTREDDFAYDDMNFFPTESGAAFYEFIGTELIPYMENNYNASNFRIVVGHDLGANFINYFLFKELPLFRAYISLSPEFAPEMVGRLSNKFGVLTQDTFYYMATADGDIRALKTEIETANATLSNITNEKLHFNFDNFIDANHYSLVGRGIPKALNSIFSLYKPINRKEYDEKILTYEGSPFGYLMKKYEDLERIYGFKKQISENDIRAIAAASKKKNDVESMQDLSKLANRTFPKSMLSAYYTGMYYEMSGNLNKALKKYQAGLLLEPSQFIDKDMMLDKMYDLEEELKN